MTTLDSAIIGAFLFFTVIVGVLAGKNVKTMRDFALGSKDFLTITLVMTIFATYIDGESILNGATQGFKSGVSFILVDAAAPLSMILYGFVAHRVSRYNNAISVGDIIGATYGKYAQVFTGISGFLISAALVASQFKALSFVFDYFYGIDSLVGVVLSAVILIAYSAFGGVRAVTWTDVIQFFILVNAVPLVTSISLNKVGGIFNLFAQLPASKIALFPADKETAYKYLVYFIAVIIPLCSPPMIQRMLMTKNPKQSQNAYWIAAAICFPLCFISIIAGLTGFILNPDVEQNNVFLYLIDTCMPSGLKGFAVAGIIAVIMSTADSFMNTAAISFSHDFYKTLAGDKLSEFNELNLTKISSLIIGVLACIMALRFDNLLDIMLYSYVLWGPVVSIPLLASIFGIKAPKYAFYVAMIAGASTAILWNINGMESKTYIHELLPALFANCLSFFSCIMYEKMKNSCVK